MSDTPSAGPPKIDIKREIARSKWMMILCAQF